MRGQNPPALPPSTLVKTPRSHCQSGNLATPVTDPAASESPPGIGFLVFVRTDGFLGRRTKKEDFHGKSHTRRKQSSENISQDKNTQPFSPRNKDSQIARC